MEQGPDELDQDGVDREQQLIAETNRPLDHPKPAGDGEESEQDGPSEPGA